MKNQWVRKCNIVQTSSIRKLVAPLVRQCRLAGGEFYRSWIWKFHSDERTFNQEDRTLNTQAPDNKASTYVKQKVTELTGERHKSAAQGGLCKVLFRGRLSHSLLIVTFC